MSMRYTLRLFKGGSSTAFRNAMEQTAKSSNAVLIWNRVDDQDMRLCHNDKVHTLYIPYRSGADDRFCEALGKHLALPWMELRIQDGALWDYALCDGVRGVDNFSTLPQYWDDIENPDPDVLKGWKGNPQLLASLWVLPVRRIERYLVNWGCQRDPSRPRGYRHVLTGKAYPSDRAPYGDYEQFFDFLHALGRAEPTERHSLILPPLSQWK